MSEPIKQELRYKMYCMNGKDYDLDQADLDKLKQNAGEMLVTLKQVMIHPPSVSAIEPYYRPYEKEYDRLDGNVVLKGLRPPTPIKDLFQPVAEILKLNEGTKT